ncbi:MAG: aminotransferase class III-fold pyridoxal phosphate-dependent enzyme [Halioglobus sp.]
MDKDKESPTGTAQLGHVKFGAYDPAVTEHIDLIERRNKHLAGSFLMYHDPIHIVEGKGAYLFDAKGRRYIDCYNNVQSMGHANPLIANAIAEQSARLTTHTRYLNENVIELAEEVASTLPGELEVCLFVCSGTEACELAMRIARVITGNSGAIVMESSYHGNSKLVGEMSTATYPPENRPPYIQAIEPPNTYRGSFRSGEGRDDQLGHLYAERVDPAIDALAQSGEGLAAFVCDSIFDSNGAMQAPPDYFQQVYRKVRAAGGLCIADEVQAGVCRTGKFWGFENYDVVPDIVFTGKPFGGGYPVAAVFTTRAIADQWARSDFYFNTFGGNPVAAAAARAVFQFAREQHMLEHVNTAGNYLRKGLEQLADRHAVIGNIQGLGLFICVDLVEDRETRVPATQLASQLPDAMKAEGVLIGLTGRYGNCLKFRPPLVFSEEDVDATLQAFDKVLTRLENG